MERNNLLTIFLIVFAFTTLIPNSQAATESCWICGSIVSIPEEASYNNQTYFQFTFNVNSSNAAWITEYPTSLTVIVPIDLLVNIALRPEAIMNLTGIADVAGFPEGYFVVEKINTQSGAWTDTLKQLWLTICTIGGTLVTLVVQIVETFTGITLPTWTVSLILVAMTTFFFIKFFKRLPLIIMVILFFVCAALVSSMIQSLMLG